MQSCSGPGSNRRFRFGRPALCRLSYHCAHPSQAPSGIRTRDIEPGQLAFCRLNYRRASLFSALSTFTSALGQWARMESNHHLRFFRPPLYRRAASPRDHVRSAPPAGIEPATFRLTTGRSVPLSYGDVCVSAEGGGIEPPRHLVDVFRVSSAVHYLSANPPSFAQAEGERLELPVALRPSPVFETGALPVRLTLHFRSQMMMNRCYSSPRSFPIAAGRIRTCTCAVLETAASAVGLLRPEAFMCSAQDSNLQQRDSHSRASAVWATRATDFSGRRRDSNPHPLGANQGSCQLEDGPSVFSIQHFLQRCEQDSNLHPRPSEGRARPIELSQRRSFPVPHRSSRRSGTNPAPPVRLLRNAPSRIRTCTRMEGLLRPPRLPDSATGATFTAVMHRAGVEPATLRLKAGGSAG